MASVTFKFKQDVETVYAFVSDAEAVRKRSEAFGDRDIRIGLRWLRAMLVLTLEGFLCDPVHGGNRDEAAWRWLGHVPGQPRPTTPYLRMDDLAR